MIDLQASPSDARREGMSLKRYLIVVSVFCLWASLAGSLEWREFGPPGATLLNVVRGTGWVYAFGRDQVYKSNDAGLTWQNMPQVPLVQGDYLVDGIVFGATEQAILAVRSSKGILRWDVASNSWIEVNQGITPPTPPYGWQFIGISAATPASTRAFAGVSTGLFYSDDFGDSWHKVSANYAFQGIVAAADGSVYYDSGSSQQTQPFRLESDLTTLTGFTMRPGLPQNRAIYGTIAPNPENPLELLFVESVDNKAYYSTDRGETWSSPALGTVPQGATSAGWLNGTPIVFSESSAYSLNKQTQTWSLLWTRPVADQYKVIAANANTLLLWGLQTNIWRSTNEGSTWASASSGMHSWGSVRAIAVAEETPRSIYVGLSTSGVWRTRDDGKTWSNAVDGIVADPYYGISVRTLEVNPANSEHLLVATEETGGTGSLYSTTNGGNLWSKVTWENTSIVNDLLFVPTQTNIVLAALVGNGIWRSINGGTTWTKIIGLPDVNNATTFTCEAGGRIFCGVIGGFDYPNDYYYSDNAGETWSRGAGAPLVKSFASDPTQPGRVMAGTGWWGSGSGLYFTANNGTEWNAANTGLPINWGGTYPEADSLIAIPGNAGGYCLAMGNGVYQTQNEGTSWTKITGSEPIQASVLAYSTRNQGTVFCGSSVNGLWYAQLVEPLPTFTPTPQVSWDLNDDGVIDSLDLLLLSVDWGSNFDTSDLLRLLDTLK